MVLAALLSLSDQLAGDLTQLTAADYRFAERLPDGAVVVVGGNGSGAEIAEDLHLAGRSVHLFTQPCRGLLRTRGLAGLGVGNPIDIGDLVRRGLRLYGALTSVEAGRLVAEPGLYLGCRTTELDLVAAGVTSVVWCDDAAAQLVVVDTAAAAA